jgi:Zn-dependent protease with chaperone function
MCPLYKTIRLRLSVVTFLAFTGTVSTSLLCQQTTILNITGEKANPQDSERARERLADEVVPFVGPMIENQLLIQVIEHIRPFLNPQDRALEESLIVKIEYAETPNARAYLDKIDKGKYIVFTTGLYTYLEDLITAEVLSRKNNAKQCGDAYTSYLIKSVHLNASFDPQHILAPTETYIPKIFAAHHPEICPELSMDDSKLDEKGLWHDQYQDAIHTSFLFVMLHEFAHVKNDDISHPLFRSLENLQAARQRETAADDFALDFIVQQKYSPLAALPVMALIAGLQDYPTEAGQFDPHPATLERTKAMYSASQKVIKSRRFQEWVKIQGPDSVHSSEEFLKMFNKALNTR